jgi:hypothetical protein
MRTSERWYFELLLKLEIGYRVIISWRILVSFRGFFEDYNFCMVKYSSFHDSSFCLKMLFNVNDKATMWHTPCWSTYTWVHLGRFVEEETFERCPKVLDRCWWDHVVLFLFLENVFWALFQTDNPNTVVYSHQWCTRILVYMHLGLPKWFAGFGLCSAGLIFNRILRAVTNSINLGAPLLSSWISLPKKIGQTFTCWD